MNKVCKRIIIINIVVAVLVAGFVVVTLLLKDREEMPCAFYSLIGLYCPGCGGTRAVYSLLRLRLFDAIKYNITVPFGAFVYIYYNIRAIICLVKKDDSYFKNNRYYLCIAFAAVLVCNFILKNMLLLCFDVRFM